MSTACSCERTILQLGSNRNPSGWYRPQELPALAPDRMGKGYERGSIWNQSYWVQDLKKMHPAGSETLAGIPDIMMCIWEILATGFQASGGGVFGNGT